MKEKQYAQTIDSIQKAVLNTTSKYHHASYQRLANFSDTFGPRLFGSKVLQLAIEDLYQQALTQGLDNVRKQKFSGFTRWTRGKQSLTLLSPRPFPSKLRVIGLGMSIPGNVTAQVVVVRNYDQLDRLGTAGIKGKIVCFYNQWTNYSSTVIYRSSGPSRVSAYGGLAVLIRSVTPFSIDSPHTGKTNYAGDFPEIPAAAITVEDAEMFWRMQSRGQKIVVNLSMQSSFQENAASSNMIAQVQGSEKPDEVVLLGGHIDSWDTGSQTGANDDGGGVMTTFQALRLIKQLGLKPKRTIRFIAWSGEQMGGANNGANSYFKMHEKQLPKHIAAFESDLGSTWIYGFGFTGT